MSVKTIIWVVALVIGVALLIVVGSAILAYLQAGRREEEVETTVPSESESSSPQVSETTIYLSGYGSPTGYGSTSSTSSTLPGSLVRPGRERVQPERESPVPSGAGQTKTPKPHQGADSSSGPLVHLQAQILGLRVEVSASRQKSPKLPLGAGE